MIRSAFPKAGVLLPLVLFLFVSSLFAAPVKLSTISVSPNSFTGGNGAPACTVTLTSAAGNHGAAVTITSSNTSTVSSTTINVPSGQTTASVPLTTFSVPSNTNVTLTASMNGSKDVATTVTVLAPVCSLATQPQPSIPAGDQVWVDDTSGGNSPGVYWDTTQSASGTQSLTMPAVGPTTLTDFAFGLPTATTINTGDSFVVYVLLDPCAPPATVGFTWSESAIGRVRGAYWGQTNPQWDSTGWWTHVGPLPAAGSWARLTFESPIMAGGIVDVSNTFQIGGKAWYDHYGTFNAGSACTFATQPQPSIPAGDQVWVDDTSGGNSPEVSWDTTQAASGTQSLAMATLAPTTEAGFGFGLPTATTINAGESFVVYVLLDPCAPPASVGFTWSASAIGRVRGAYWGQTNSSWDASGIWTHVGPLPAAGSWSRLTFDATTMAGTTIDVSNTYLVGGKAWFDHYGTFSAACSLATQPQPSIPAGDHVWVDDTSGGLNPPSGGVYWDTTQSASGTQSLTMPAVGPTTLTDFAFGLPTPTTINAGDSFVVYVLLDPCAPPATVGFTWSESALGRVRGAYWGQTNAQWDSTGWWTHVGPLPAAGSWVRLTFNSPIMAGGTVDVSNTFQIGGKVWYDHYGTFQP